MKDIIKEIFNIANEYNELGRFNSNSERFIYGSGYWKNTIQSQTDMLIVFRDNDEFMKTKIIYY